FESRPLRCKIQVTKLRTVMRIFYLLRNDALSERCDRWRDRCSNSLSFLRTVASPSTWQTHCPKITRRPRGPRGVPTFTKTEARRSKRKRGPYGQLVVELFRGGLRLLGEGRTPT